MAFNHNVVCDQETCVLGNRCCQPFSFEQLGENFGDAIGAMEEVGWEFDPITLKAKCPFCTGKLPIPEKKENPGCAC